MSKRNKSRLVEELELTYRQPSQDIEEIYSEMFRKPESAPVVPFPTPPESASVPEAITTPVVMTPVVMTGVETTPVNSTPVITTPPITTGVDTEEEPAIPSSSSSPAGRAYNIHRAVVAQDGHSHSEQVLYELLWRSGKAVDADERYRVVQIPQSELAAAVRMTTKNLRAALDRLTEKLSIEEVQSFDRGTRVARKWKVYSYKAILDRRRAAGLEWIVRDRGIRFVDPITTPVKTTRVVMEEQDITTPVNTTKTTPVITTETTPVITTTRSLLGFIYREEEERTSTTISAATVASALQETTGHSDDDAVHKLIAGCQSRVPNATAEEIAYFIREQAARLGRNKQVRNLIGLLIVQVPKCFEGESFRLYREAEQRRKEAEKQERDQWRREAQAILDNPHSSAQDKEWARTMLETTTGEGKLETS